jgi:DNA-binding transcriptional ArsR family regulator
MGARTINGRFHGRTLVRSHELVEITRSRVTGSCVTTARIGLIIAKLRNIAIMNDIESLVRTLRAVADPARLRLLRLCVEKPVSVSELAIMTGDSEPNVSRQLKQLALAGLLRRVRRGQRVEYQPVEFQSVDNGAAQMTLPMGGALVRLLMAQLDSEESSLREARARLRGIEARQRASQASVVRSGVEPLQRGRLGMTCAVTLGQTLVGDAAGQRVCLRVAQREIFDAVVASAGEIVLRVETRRERDAINTWLRAEGLPGVVQTSSELRTTKNFAVCIEVALAGELADERQLGSLLLRLRACLRPEGIAYCAVPYDALATSSPLSHWRRMLTERGFECLSLHPIEVDGHHLVMTRARVKKQ